MVDIRHLRKIEKQVHNKKVVAENSNSDKPLAGKKNQVKAKTEANVPADVNNTVDNKIKSMQPAQPGHTETATEKTAAETITGTTKKPAETTADKPTPDQAQPLKTVKEPEQQQTEDSHQVETRELVTFKLDGRYFGIFVDKVHSVVKPSEITRVPKLEDYLKGIMNLRGIITPVYDLKRRFEIGVTDILSSTRIIILEMQNNLVGFMVDEIADLYHIQVDSVLPPPEMLQGLDRRFIKGVVALDNLEELILILALDEIVDHINFRESN